MKRNVNSHRCCLHTGIPYFIALHSCCVFYKRKARPCTSKRITIRFMARSCCHSGPDPAARRLQVRRESLFITRARGRGSARALARAAFLGSLT